MEASEPKDTTFTIAGTLREAVERYKRKTGEWPNVLSDNATEYFGFLTTWDRIDSALRNTGVLSLELFCKALEEANGQPRTFQELSASAEAERRRRIRPSILDAVFVRISEVSGGKWNVDIYTPDGWGTLFKADSENEADEIVQVLIRQHHFKTRSPVRLPKAEPTPTT